MSNINLKRFVDIDIVSHITRGVESTRDTIVLFTNDTTSAHNTEAVVLAENSYSANLVDVSNYESIYTGKPNTLAYLKTYFDNGGVKALVIEGVAATSLTANMIKDLDNKYLLVAYAVPFNSINIETVFGYLSAIATARNADSTIYGINEKILIAGTNSTAHNEGLKNFATKYYSLDQDLSGDTVQLAWFDNTTVYNNGDNVMYDNHVYTCTVAATTSGVAFNPTQWKAATTLAAEMTIAAYLSKIDVYGLNTVYDYAFTTENIIAEKLSDSAFGTLMTNNYNVDIELANAIRNAGGNCQNGADLTNTYVKIILHQTLTDSLINLLTEKLKSSTGIAKIYSAISEELENYLNCGYLTTDKIWKDPTYTITRNGTQYTIIEKGTPLLNGYKITILPMSSLTTEEKAAHSAPPIYVIIADQYGIRKITINGEVI